jgi:hypothetical protein
MRLAPRFVDAVAAGRAPSGLPSNWRDQGNSSHVSKYNTTLSFNG